LRVVEIVERRRERPGGQEECRKRSRRVGSRCGGGRR
jgi:hypothetical protein